MQVSTNQLVPMTEANQNFSKVVRMVDDQGMAVILKNNKPRYIVVGFDEYDDILAMRPIRAARIDEAANRILDKNIAAFEELAK